MKESSIKEPPLGEFALYNYFVSRTIKHFEAVLLGRCDAGLIGPSRLIRVEQTDVQVKIYGST